MEEWYLVCNFANSKLLHGYNKFTRHEQVCLIRLRFERYFFMADDGRNISRNVA